MPLFHKLTLPRHHLRFCSIVLHMCGHGNWQLYPETSPLLQNNPLKKIQVLADSYLLVLKETFECVWDKWRVKKAKEKDKDKTKQAKHFTQLAPLIPIWQQVYLLWFSSLHTWPLQLDPRKLFNALNIDPMISMVPNTNHRATKWLFWHKIVTKSFQQILRLCFNNKYANIKIYKLRHIILIDWSIDRPTDWLIVSIVWIDWLTDWLTDLTDSCITLVPIILPTLI